MAKQNKQMRNKAKAHLHAVAPKRNARGHIVMSQKELVEAIVMYKRQMRNVPVYHASCTLGSMEMAHSLFTLVEDYLGSSMPTAEFHTLMSELITDRMAP